MRKIGHEFGATTGRPRRCGWIDLVALNYACILNGVTQIVMTKSDVLDSFTALKVCTAYKVDGKETAKMPYQLNGVDVQPVYQEFKGWDRAVAACNSIEELPIAFQEYLKFITEYLKVEVRYISNGPGRDQIIYQAEQVTV